MSMFLIGTVSAMPPHPDAMEEIRASKQATAEYNLELERMRELGINEPDDGFKNLVAKRGASASPLAATPYRILALLVDFSDNVKQVNAPFFDTLLFDSSGVSVWHYFDEVSYSQIDLVTVDMPSSTGWYRAPQTYAYYVDSARGLYGDYPNNTQKLVEDLVDMADADVDFSQYDNDSDGYVDALVVIHSGPGYERTLDVTDIHSHKWGISARLKDGVFIQSYTIQPEYMTTPGDQTIGVYCHELGHILGLPDLYDTDYSSRGVGDWCLMAGGSWNGVNGSSPAHPSAWCRKQLAWGTVVNVGANSNNQTIGAVETGGSIFRLWNSGDSGSSEYFLVENRQQTGYDLGLPSSGLLIWHIDDTKLGVTDNTAEWWPGQSGANHYLVALEQADNQFNLEHDANDGDAGDPFPGSTSNFSFTSITSPNSDSYEAGATIVGVTNISASGMTMVADLIVGLSAGIFDPAEDLLPGSVELLQNYPNPFNPSTTIEFSVLAGSYLVLEVYNIAGQKVRTLYDGYAEPGTQSVTWDATDNDGRPVATGIYLYKLNTDDQDNSKKMVLVR
jgi:immune inhibitor A